MLIAHRGRRPTIHASAYIAPTAVVCGDVTIGPGSRVLFGAVVTAEGGPVLIGEDCIVMEQAVIRGRDRHPVRIGNHVLVGPHAHINGATVEDDVFLATGCSLFPGARIETRAEVRISGVVHVNSRLAAGATVPIGWVAVGDPATILPPNEHDAIWAIQRELDFPGTVLGVGRAPERQTIMPAAMRRYSEWLGAHLDDEILPEEGRGPS